jgi:hypothetical protein
MGTPQAIGSRGEFLSYRICKCGHIGGIHYGPTGVCKAEKCPCIEFREFIPEPQGSTGFDPKPMVQGHYGKSDT